MIADLQISNGDKVAKEIGGSTAFVATDVRARTVVSAISQMVLSERPNCVFVELGRAAWENE